MAACVSVAPGGVRGNALRAGSDHADRRGETIEPIHTAGRQPDVVPVTSQLESEGPPDPARSARDDCDSSHAPPLGTQAWSSVQPGQPIRAFGYARLHPDGEVEVPRNAATARRLPRRAPALLSESPWAGTAFAWSSVAVPASGWNIQRQRLVVTRFRLRQPPGPTMHVSEMPHRRAPAVADRRRSWPPATAFLVAGRAPPRGAPHPARRGRACLARRPVPARRPVSRQMATASTRCLRAWSTIARNSTSTAGGAVIVSRRKVQAFRMSATASAVERMSD